VPRRLRALLFLPAVGWQSLALARGDQTLLDAAKTESLFYFAEHSLNRRLVLPSIPDFPRLRMHADNEYVDVRVRAVAVRDDDRLVILQLELREYAIRDALHRGAAHGVSRIEAQREMVDRFFDAQIL
jgi:hypothetical protein